MSDFTVTDPMFIPGSYINTAWNLQPYSVVSVGDGKFVAVFVNANRPSSSYNEIGWVVFTIDNEGIVTSGSPGYFDVDAGYRAMSYYDRAAEKVVIIYDGYPLGYTIASVSGLTLVADGSGTFPSTTYVYGVTYNRVQEKGVVVIAVYGASLTFSLLSLTVSGSTLILGPVNTPFTSVNMYRDTARLVELGDKVVLAYTNGLTLIGPSFRLIGFSGSNLDIGDEQFSTISDGTGILGLAGNHTSNEFVYYGHRGSDSSGVFTFIPGEISEGSLSFGSPYDYEPELPAPNSSSYNGACISVSESGDFVTFLKSGYNNSDIATFISSLDNLIVTPEASSVNINSEYDLYYAAKYMHSTAYCEDTNRVAFAFLGEESSTSDIGLFLFSAIGLPGTPETINYFWKRHTKQREKAVSDLEKLSTRTFTPGDPGQPYVAPVPALPGHSSSTRETEKVCAKP